MAELIDLTLTLGSERISLVPGLVGVETEPIQTHATHARSNQKLCLATHIGTHVDAPFHFVDGATTVENMPLEKYAGPAILLDLRSAAKEQEALTISLIHQVVPQNQLLTQIQNVAEIISERAPIAIRYAKEAILKGMDLPLESGLRLETDLNLLLHATSDRNEGINSFLERREPKFRGS